jgi:hypothetical protein
VLTGISDLHFSFFLTAFSSIDEMHTFTVMIQHAKTVQISGGPGRGHTKSVASIIYILETNTNNSNNKVSFRLKTYFKST